MTADITGHTTPRPSSIKSNEIDKRIQKLEIQVRCLRQQVLNLEGKRPYWENEEITNYGGTSETSDD